MKTIPKKNKPFTYPKVAEVVDKFITLDHRDVKQLPEEFEPFHNELLSLPEPPNEPEEYECCGNGCINCVWEVYNKKHEYIYLMKEKIFDHLNEE